MSEVVSISLSMDLYISVVYCCLASDFNQTVSCNQSCILIIIGNCEKLNCCISLFHQSTMSLPMSSGWYCKMLNHDDTSIMLPHSISTVCSLYKRSNKSIKRNFSESGNELFAITSFAIRCIISNCEIVTSNLVPLL